ncbi:unnamed protein product [Mytilus edulis]|uniref:Novel STAND NTPase 3 domain-containing protein n=1 Tax=Mytilus edulis TaxID=6550 RepID=A0A8S3S5A1_MYTED|nr:unnamed protein product [Mytilus edulis]
MALSTVAKEQDNFLRYAILIVDHSKEALQDLIELNLRNKHLSFEEFLNQNQHEIYHLCYDLKCCQCHTSPPRRKRIIYPSQLELLLDIHNKLPSHKATNSSDFSAVNQKLNINLQHRTTRQSIPRLVDKSCKMRKMEKRIDALQISVKEGPKRQILIDQTSAEIESHQKECTYLETKALRQCIQFLECRHVVILSGREGSGKSRNSLEILRQLKERHNDLDVFKLTGLHYVSDIVKYSLVDWMLNSVDNSSIDYTKCFDELIHENCRFDMVMLILKKVNNRWLNINEVVKQCCKYGFSDGLEWVMKNCDHILFDYEELFKITIDGIDEIEDRFNHHQFDYVDNIIGYSNILELLILQKPGIICCNLNQILILQINTE